MKAVGKFFQVFFSVIFTIILSLLLLVFGIYRPVVAFLQEDTLSKTIEKTIDVVAEQIMEEDENIQSEEIKQIKHQILDSVQEFGLNKEAFSEFLKDEQVKGVAGDFLSSVVVSMIDPEKEIDYPDKKELTEIVTCNKELLNEALGDMVPENENIANYSDEDIEKIISDNYDEIIGGLEEYINALKEGVQQ